MGHKNTLADLERQVAEADRLLAMELPAGERLKVAKLRLSAQIGVMLRKKLPRLDEHPAYTQSLRG